MQVNNRKKTLETTRVQNMIQMLYEKLISKVITLPTKVRKVKGMVSPVVMHGCESWTIKKAEH